MKKGFTIIELLVAVTIFLVFVSVLVGSFVAFFGYQLDIFSQTNTTRNLDIFFENFSRESRLGYNYFCIATPSFPIMGIDTKTPGEDCVDESGNVRQVKLFGFNDQFGGYTLYWIDDTEPLNDATTKRAKLARGAASQVDKNDFVRLLNEDVVVRDGSFVVTGARRDDGEQPSVLLTYNAHFLDSKGNTQVVTPQVFVSQRRIDIKQNDNRRLFLASNDTVLDIAVANNTLLVIRGGDVLKLTLPLTSGRDSYSVPYTTIDRSGTQCFESHITATSAIGAIRKIIDSQSDYFVVVNARSKAFVSTYSSTTAPYELPDYDVAGAIITNTIGERIALTNEGKIFYPTTTDTNINELQPPAKTPRRTFSSYWIDTSPTLSAPLDNSSLLFGFVSAQTNNTNPSGCNALVNGSYIYKMNAKTPNNPNSNCAIASSTGSNIAPHSFSITSIPNNKYRGWYIRNGKLFTFTITKNSNNVASGEPKQVFSDDISVIDYEAYNNRALVSVSVDTGFETRIINLTAALPFTKNNNITHQSIIKDGDANIIAKNIAVTKSPRNNTPIFFLLTGNEEIYLVSPGSQRHFMIKDYTNDSERPPTTSTDGLYTYAEMGVTFNDKTSLICQ